MNLLNHSSKALLTLSLVFSFSLIFAQQGNVSINQPSELSKLLTIKKEMNVSGSDSDRYKIQIYSGDRSEANSAMSKYNQSLYTWKVIDVYEPPNYKVWVGNFRNRLEVDRALVQIKKDFPNAFRLKPKRKN